MSERTFQESERVVVNGVMTGLYSVDLQRFNTVMSAIAYAMYFNDYGKPYNGRWEIFSPSMISRQSLAEGIPDPWDEVRELVRRLPVTQVTVVDPAAEVLAHAAAVISDLGARVQASCLNTTAEACVHTRTGLYEVITAL